MAPTKAISVCGFYVSITDNIRNPFAALAVGALLFCLLKITAVLAGAEGCQ